MTGTAPRLLCAKTLLRTVQAGSYGNLALHSALAESNLSTQEKALCTALFQGTLERLILLDACIAAHSKRPPEKLEPPVLCVLRCGICELLTLHTQEAAVCNLWTEVIKKLNRTSAAGMVNAILRAFLRGGKQIPMPKEKNAAMSVQYSVPVVLVEQLLRDYDGETVERFLADSLGEPPIYLRHNPLAVDETEFLAAFPNDTLQPVAGISGAFRVLRGGDLTGTEAFRKGWFHVQDLASQLCCMALDPQAGDTILDVCAAPGGKSFTLAELMGGKGQVFAYDLHEKRVKLIVDGARRLHLTNIRTAVGDARKTEKPLADRVLCDVPCSGFGVMRRKPEVRYKPLTDIAGLPKVQAAILEAAADSVKSGGVLVYSTCTVSQAENEAVVEAFLARHPDFQPERPWQNLPEVAGYAGEMTTLFPHMLGSDGFFVAKLRRNSE